MTETEMLHLLWPALSYPNCQVRQARLTELIRLLLLNVDPVDQITVQEVIAGWKEQDEERRYQLFDKTYRAQPIGG